MIKRILCIIILKDVKTGKEFKNLPAFIKVVDEDDNEQAKSGSFTDMMMMRTLVWSGRRNARS